MKYRIELIDKNLPVICQKNRNHDGDYLKRLGASMVLNGQLQAIGLRKDMTVIWGNGRVLAARARAEITHLLAAKFEKEITEREFLRMNAVENFVSNQLSNADKCKICVDYARIEQNMPLKEIAGDLGVDPSMVTRWLAWEKVIAPVQQALVENKITLNGMYSISQLPQDQQAQELEKALNEGKRVRNRNGAVREGKIKIPLASDSATGLVVVSGANIDLDDTEALLKEALKVVRVAKDKKLDCKTAQAVWRDVASAR